MLILVTFLCYFTKLEVSNFLILSVHRGLLTLVYKRYYELRQYIFLHPWKNARSA